MFRRSLNRRFHIFKQAGFVVDDLHGSPTQYIRRPHHDGITDLQGDAKSLVYGSRHATLRLAKPKGIQEVTKSFSIFRAIDRLGTRTQNSYPGLGQGQRGLEGRSEEHTSEMQP